MKIDRNAEAERIHAIESAYEAHETSADAPSIIPVPKGPLVKLSTEAQKVQRLRDAVENAPAIREDYVEQLRKRYLAGQLQVDSERLADVMERALRHV